MSEVSRPNKLIVEADGGSRGNPGPAGYGALVRDAASGQVLAERAKFLGVATNNYAEYSGLIAGLEAAAEINPSADVTARLDSKLVVEQMSGRWKIKHADMRELARAAQHIFAPDRVAYEWVPRADNADADALANQAMDGGADTDIYNTYPGGELVAEVPSVAEAMSVTEVTTDSMTVLLIASGLTNSQAVKDLGTGRANLIPAITWVAAAPETEAKDSARIVASALKLPTSTRSLVPEFAAENIGADLEAELASLADSLGRHTVALVVSPAVVSALISQVLHIPAPQRDQLMVANGSISVVRIAAGQPAEVVSVGMPS